MQNGLCVKLVRLVACANPPIIPFGGEADAFFFPPLRAIASGGHREKDCQPVFGSLGDVHGESPSCLGGARCSERLASENVARQISRALVRGANAAFARMGDLLSIPWARTVMIVAAVFVIDCLTPRGIAAGALYIAAVLSAVAIRHRKAIAITASICSLLVFAGWFISPRQGQMEWWVFVNRAIVLGVIWAAAAWPTCGVVSRKASSSRCRRPSCSTRPQPFPHRSSLSAML